MCLKLVDGIELNYMGIREKHCAMAMKGWTSSLLSGREDCATAGQAAIGSMPRCCPSLLVHLPLGPLPFAVRASALLSMAFQHRSPVAT